ncbi:MAG: hypothetical protein K2O42_01530, partial [Oscillospiraceae bacterium]|nr:hypothetical protein [Oscillospiraceae bacterium]
DMKKVGDLLTAFGVVGFLAVVLEFIIGWRMIPQSIILWFILGSFIIFLIGIIMRNSGGNKSDGKDMKQIGVALLIFGAILLLLAIYGLFSAGNAESILVQFVGNRFPFLVISGLVAVLVGVVLRSIGKSKENKDGK